MPIRRKIPAKGDKSWRPTDMKVAIYVRVSTSKTDKKATNEGDRARQDPETKLISYGL
jgi:hypothetical protein